MEGFSQGESARDQKTAGGWKSLQGGRLAFVGALGLVLSAAASAAPPAVPYTQPTPPTTAQEPGPLDEPLRLVELARQSYAGVRDYTCLFIKREQIRGRLQADNLIAMKVRAQPFSVYLQWLGPTNMAGQEACYVAGRNNGQMRVHPTGVRGAFGFISLDPQDPRVMENSRHAITDAGIGNLIERYSQRWLAERTVNRTQVRVADYEYNKRKCTRVETLHPDRSAAQYYAYRNVVYFDKESHLPIRVESYDWPRAGGPAQGDLLEAYSYVDLRVNVNLGDGAFNY